MLMWLLCMVASAPLTAQETGVKGRVTSASSGNPAEGVTVTVKGSKKGTSTTPAGSYSVQAKKGETLVFSGIGFVTREAVVSGPTLDVALEATSGDLGEVVVVGYGTQRKANLTGALVTLSNATITKRQVTSTSQVN